MPVSPRSKHPVETRSGYQHTYRAVVRQIGAMAVPCYDVGLLHPRNGMLLRTWSPQEIIAGIPWLRYMNGIGHHVFLRPTASLGVVLLDDLGASAIIRLKHDGLQPAAVVETSKDNYQCWIRLIHNREQCLIPTNLVHRLLRDLIDDYGADPCCSDWRHFGRLAGFTNQKLCHTRRDGRQPFVLLRFAAPVVAPQGRERLLRSRVRLRRQMGLRIAQSTSAPGYVHHMERILSAHADQPWATNPDFSRLDFMIARDMLRDGLAPGAVAAEINAGSPNLNLRKQHHVDDYIRRTISAAQRDLSLSPH